MKFRTELALPSQHPKIKLETQLLSLGSCFSDEIGQKMADYKFKIRHNPFGILFNPISIFKLINDSLQHQQVDSQHFVCQQEHWFHYDFHSQWNDHSQQALQLKLEEQLQSSKDWLATTNVLMLTFGTAWVHELLESQEIVANCHKVPQSHFQKRLLTLEELLIAFEKTLSLLPKTISILLTVSPIRHTKEGLENNQVSKSLLRLFCHFAAEKYENVRYFPSYELVLDDLRDYRFFKEDLIHPNSFSIDYIWKKFSQAYFDEEALVFIQEWQKIRTAMQHRPFHPNTTAHHTFLQTLFAKIKGFSTQVNVEEELQMVEELLKS